MTIELKPEDEALIQERLDAGDGASMEDVVHHALVAWARLKCHGHCTQPRSTTLSEFLMNSPLSGSELNLERDQDLGSNSEL
jgi:hypothetical protein